MASRQTNVATSQLQPRQGLSCGVAMFPFEILRLPSLRTETCRVVPQLAALILARCRPQILRLPAKSALSTVVKQRFLDATVWACSTPLNTPRLKTQAACYCRGLYRSHVLSTFFGVLGTMMKQVCWHSRRSEAHRDLPEARPRTQNVMARGQSEAHGDSNLYNTRQD